MYIPKSQISRKTTSGGLLVFKSDKTPYIGNYIKTSKNKYYAGHNSNNVGLELELLKSEESSNEKNRIVTQNTYIQKFNILKKEIKLFLEKTQIIPSFKSIPQEQDYTRGYYTRYFTQRINGSSYIEISKKVFNSLKLKDGKYDHNLYIVGSLRWYITGNDVHKQNSLSILKKQQTYPNIFSLFPILNEFLRASLGVREDLNTNGGELYYANGTEYIGLYHIHPEQGPMVGAKHSELPHSKLYYTSQLPKIPGKEYEDFISNYSPNTGFEALTCYRCIKTPTGQNQVVGFIPKDKNLGCGKNSFTDYNLAVQSCNDSQVRNPEIINESPSSTPAQQVNEAPSTRSIPNITPSSGGGGGY